ncbi:MAG: hypothetical protein K2X87_30890 [Gemmataceae bacterium]|nr:hypothetical protein [Gemmataceae bacterium]
MRQMQQDLTSDAGWVVFWALLAAVAFAVTGCSFQVEVGYHGQTGRDDRTQTQLVRGADRGAVRAAKDDERY